MVSLGPGISGATLLVCLCQCSLPAVHLNQEGRLLFCFGLWKVCTLSVSLPLSPQAVGCDIIDLGGGKSLEREPLSPHYRLHTHTHALCWCLTSVNMEVL